MADVALQLNFLVGEIKAAEAALLHPPIEAFLDHLLDLLRVVFWRALLFNLINLSSF